MNKKIIGLSATSITAILIAVAFVSLPTNSSQIKTFEETFVPGHVPAPMPMSIFLKNDEVKDLAEASLVVRKSINLPQYLPEGYKIQLISANAKGVKVYASADTLTRETTDQEFVWKQKGITINITPRADSKVAQDIISQLEMNTDYSPISIEGKIAAGHEIIRFDNGDGTVGSAQAELLYYNDNNKIVVHGLHPLGELAKIAASIP